MLVGILPMSVLAGEEGCPHTNLTYIENELIDPSCFEPGLGGYWFCEECGQYLDKSKEHGYWEEALASKIPALGHAFNADTGKCDNCDLENPVYSKVTSLADINEEDMYIFVAEVDGRYFVLGGLDESTATSNEQGTVDCGEGGNAIPVVPYDDGSISLLNQSYVGNARPKRSLIIGIAVSSPITPNVARLARPPTPVRIARLQRLPIFPRSTTTLALGSR